MGADDIWTDAGDARVCPMCMSLGASWNARLDTPISSEEADEALDRAKRKEFLKAIEKDSTIADQIIRDAAATAESGLIKNIHIGTAGETLTVRVEREAVRILADARARAAVPIGTPVRGFGPTTEGLIFEPTPSGRKAPRFVSVTIAQGLRYRVLRRRGKYVLQTTGGRAIESGDNLALLLLLFALMEKKRRDEEAKKEAANANR